MSKVNRLHKYYLNLFVRTVNFLVTKYEILTVYNYIDTLSAKL